MPNPIGIGRHSTLVSRRAERSLVRKEPLSFDLASPLYLLAEVAKRLGEVRIGWQKMHVYSRSLEDSLGASTHRHSDVFATSEVFMS